MNKRIIVNIAIIILIIILGIILIDQFRGDSKGDNPSNPAGYQQESSTQETEETQKPIEIKDNKDDGFSDLIPIKPANP